MITNVMPNIRVKTMPQYNDPTFVQWYESNYRRDSFDTYDEYSEHRKTCACAWRAAKEDSTAEALATARAEVDR
jgi:hypothetical protein